MKIKFLIIFVIVLTGNLKSQETTNYIDVNLDITTDEVTDDLLNSYLLRELRLYDDIKIKSREESEFVLSVICIKSDAGFYTASVSVLKPIRYNEVRDNIAIMMGEVETIEQYEENQTRIDSSSVGEFLRLLLDSVENNRYQILLLDGDLKSLSERIVASVNVKVFERKRMIFQETSIDN